MRTIFVSFLAIGLFTASAQGANRLDQLFASWERMQGSVRSLVVEYTCNEKDIVFNDVRDFEGIFRLLRTPEGHLLASWEETVKAPNSCKLPRISYLLLKDTIYVLRHDEKKAIRLKWESLMSDDQSCTHFFSAFLNKTPEVKKTEVRDGLQFYWLESFVNPFVVLLNRKYAEDCIRLEIAGQDEKDTYLTVKPKRVKEVRWPGLGTFGEGRAVFTNNASIDRPKDVPRKVWYEYPNGSEKTIEIKTWRMNAADGPKAEEFARPEDWPGWEVEGDKRTEPEPVPRKKGP